MNVKVKRLADDALIPFKRYEEDAGYDLHSVENITLPVGSIVTVRTGLSFALPKGYAMLIWDRSGMAAKHGIKTMAGVIESNYRGELKVVLANLSKRPFQVEKGMRIAQMLIQKIEQAVFDEVDILDDTERGSEGFGSSGMHSKLL